MSEKKEFEPLDVGATERVDWKVAQGLNKYVHFDESGNAVIGKNLEIDGTTKLNGGLNPVATYTFVINGSTYTLQDYGSLIGTMQNLIALSYDNLSGVYIGIGIFDISPSTVSFNLSYYSPTDGEFGIADYSSLSDTDVTYSTLAFNQKP